ncbi:MAG: flagellar biosynthesis protein FlgM, partial [Paenibacillus sp.]|nr:flagellar biosynthesis protein FlgM [Paenibacillus sp.]
MEQNTILPNILGEGGLFAFSGMDGETQSLTGFTATWGAVPYSLLFHTKRRRALRLGAPSETTETVFVTGDACQLRAPAGELTVVYSAWHTLSGRSRVGTLPTLVWEDGPEAIVWSPDVRMTGDEANGEFIALAVRGDRFGLSYGKSAEEAAARALAGTECDIELETEQRLRMYRRLPLVPDANDARLLQKCFSVMKVNTLRAEGSIRQMWSTPDRVPHKDMWLWDTVFHSLAMNELDADVSWQCLKSMLDSARPDGMIVHHVSASGKLSSITQPPILAWGIWLNYRVEPDAAKLQYALPILERYLEWDMANRDANGNGLLEWAIEGNVFCRSGESGMDNSSRFDEALQLDAVDFSTFVAVDMAYTAKIAEELGMRDKAEYWRSKAATVAGRIESELWDEADGFYYDKRMDGRLTKVKAVSGFLPLLLEETPKTHVDRLVDMLRHPEHFGTAYPVPSIAISEPAWGTDMWRGPTWINLNFLIVEGLRLHERHDEAQRLADRTIELVRR